MTKEAGAQLVLTKTRVTLSGHNERIYLINAVTALLPSEEKKQCTQQWLQTFYQKVTRQYSTSPMRFLIMVFLWSK